MSEATHSFYKLTPERVLLAVEQLGVRCTGRVLQLNSMENRVYEVELSLSAQEAKNNSRYSAFRVIKFYRPGRWSKEQILDEHAFIRNCLEQELPVVSPISFSDGETLRTLTDTEIFFCIFPKVGGRTMDELDDANLERIGRLIARLHNVGASQKAKHRMLLSPKTYGLDNLEYLKSSNVVPAELRERIFTLISSLCNIFAGLFDGIRTQRIHGDLHCGNILWDREDCMLVDFDDMLNGPCVQDLWLLVPGRDEDSKRRFEVLLRGYQQMRDFDNAELYLIEPLRTLRIIHFIAWIAKRYEDPAFQRVFTNFGSQEYWRDQLMTLEEQLQIMHSGQQQY